MTKTLLSIFILGLLMDYGSAEPMFALHSSSSLSVDGLAIKALKIACDEFESSGKDLTQFIVNISIPESTENNQNGASEVYIVTFMGRFLPGKTKGLGSANLIPGSVKYFISKENWEIIKKQGFR